LALLRRLAGRLALLLVPALAASACAHDYVVENRDTPVHVWISVPEFEAQGGTLSALVYVGGQKVVDGVINFSPGKPTVVLPSVHLRTGTVPVSAVLFDGAVSATENVGIEQESWVQIVVRGKTATIRATEEQPNPRCR